MTLNKAKSILAGFLIGSIIFFNGNPNINVDASTMPSTIYEFKESKHLGSGIIHENINTYTTEGLWGINVLRIDIQNEHTELQGLINPEGLNYRGTVSHLVKSNDAIAGINGDYFNYSPKPSAMGTLINNGEVISSPIEKAYALPTFFLDVHNNGGIDYFHRHISIQDTTNNQTININTLNKVTPNFDTLTVLDKNWGHVSIGNQFHKDLVEVVVQGGAVQDVRVGQGPAYIPRNGYVIAGRGQRADVLKTLKPGDILELTVQTTPNKESLKFAIGGGSIILKDGQATRTNIVDNGVHPRTGIGINQEGTEIILVTVDGRVATSNGMSQKTFSELMKNLGAYQALNLDGGGSTTMVTRENLSQDPKVVNKPSQGSQRKVVNAIGVFNNSPKGVLDRIEIKTEVPKMLMGTNNRVSLIGYDGHNEVVSLDSDKISLSFEGEAYSFEDGLLSPGSPGTIKINASYNTGTKVLTDSLEISVLGEIQNIYADKDEIKVDPGQTYNLPRFFGQDSNGSTAEISLRDLNVDIPEEIGKISNGKFISSTNPKSGYIKVSLGNGVENIKIISTINPEIGPAPSKSYLRDPLNRKESIKSPTGYKISVFSHTNNMNDYSRVQALQSKLNASDIAISLNGTTQEFINQVTNPVYIDAGAGYKDNKKGDVFIANLDSRAGGMRKSNSYQWIRLRNEIKNRPESNLILTTQRPITGSGGWTDSYEAQAFHDTLVDIKNTGKNVFLVHGGYAYGSKLKDGIRYISMDSRNTKTDAAIDILSVLEFTVNDAEVTYEYNKIFE